MTDCKTGKLGIKYNTVMEQKAFIEKVKTKDLWDYVVYYKQWGKYDIYIAGLDSEKGDFGEEQVILAQDGDYRYASYEEKKSILNLF